MFTSILSNSASYITFEQIALCFFGALLCGFVIALAYHMLADMSRSFALTLTLLPAIVMMVIMMVNGNLGVGVAVGGSFSLVRFRSQPGRQAISASSFWRWERDLPAAWATLPLHWQW
ncbi:MAG: DUF4956 domain-containing protein [Galactobacillus timonensis]|uniref:hypothetical protein n=1 Tax=Galactobacillus timonensis TaxID=2041840 RepID=UPI0023F5436C|nr:hypothetical protein [Galactobacillus timonensis]MCI6067028.1 DUF4956 domain-containing protein [Galactobacillus timonensis]MCI6754405.1 DUF4956 domain-containing protein [Galactobacillus timonensis]MDD7087585.1 hypothetical protein [Galactobacillus timonensis]MDY5222001.1 hypothetical protein [Lachnospiraceae bacterium]